MGCFRPTWLYPPPYPCPSHSRISSTSPGVFAAKWTPFVPTLRFPPQNTGNSANSELKSGQLTEVDGVNKWGKKKTTRPGTSHPPSPTRTSRLQLGQLAERVHGRGHRHDRQDQNGSKLTLGVSYRRLGAYARPKGQGNHWAGTRVQARAGMGYDGRHRRWNLALPTPTSFAVGVGARLRGLCLVIVTLAVGRARARASFSIASWPGFAWEYQQGQGTGGWVVQQWLACQ